MLFSWISNYFKQYISTKEVNYIHDGGACCDTDNRRLIIVNYYWIISPRLRLKWWKTSQVRLATLWRLCRHLFVGYTTGGVTYWWEEWENKFYDFTDLDASLLSVVETRHQCWRYILDNNNVATVFHTDEKWTLNKSL